MAENLPIVPIPLNLINFYFDRASYQQYTFIICCFVRSYFNQCKLQLFPHYLYALIPLSSLEMAFSTSAFICSKMANEPNLCTKLFVTERVG